MCQEWKQPLKNLTHLGVFNKRGDRGKHGSRPRSGGLYPHGAPVSRAQCARPHGVSRSLRDGDRLSCKGAQQPKRSNAVDRRWGVAIPQVVEDMASTTHASRRLTKCRKLVPVREDSSAAVRPSRTTPSTGNRSPGRTSTVSPASAPAANSP